MAVNRSSLFDSAGASAMASAMDWSIGMLFGSLAVTLAVLAVAFVGLTMLGGRLPVRRGLRVVIGCFLLLGAPAIAAAFMSATQEVAQTARLAEPVDEPERPRDLPPSNFDPYAGASLRRE